MKKDIIIGALLLIIGIVIGLLFRPNNRHKAENTPQNDTIIVHDTITHSKMELAQNTLKLDIPNIGARELVFIKEDSTTIIYRDSVRYVTYPREYFYTNTGDAEIWHSGIDSTIDSLNVVRKTQEITKATQSVTNRNALAIGLDMNYSSHPDIPIYIEYSYLLHTNVEMSARLQYDLPSQEIGFGLGAKISIGW